MTDFFISGPHSGFFSGEYFVESKADGKELAGPFADYNEAQAWVDVRDPIAGVNP